ncbi:fructose-6-phosphate aldolase [Patescibacteria group bacterium]
MQFFIDTADIEAIKKYHAWGVVDGVTTNPSLIAKEGVKFEDRIREISEVVDGPISAEVTATDMEGMLKEAREFAGWHKNIVVKIPMIEEGLKALKVLTAEGIKTNVTLVFSAGQALLAAKNGATYVSPFVGRLDDNNENSTDVIHEIVSIFKNFKFDTQILVASVRNVRHVVNSAAMGAHVATIPPKIFDELIEHPLTDKGLEAFLADWEKVKNL